MFLGTIEAVDNAPYALPQDIWLLKTHDGVTIGKITACVVESLRNVQWLSLEEQLKHVVINDASQLDAKFAQLTAQWRSENKFDCLKGWRDELYTCYTVGGVKYFSIERSAACLFGIVTYGCHINGFCPDTKQLWVPRRSPAKPTYPGLLDNTVAGGLGADLTFHECAVKECAEEAGLSAAYLETRLFSSGVVTYEHVDPATHLYQPEVECVYDLIMESPQAGGLVPTPVDGEVQNFELMSYAEVKDRILKGEFKYNCALVLVDFFIRHGEITTDTEPDYLEIVSRCHRRLEYPLRRS